MNDNRELEPFLEVCEEFESQRNMINRQIGQAKRHGNEIPDELIAEHNKSLQAAKKFPDCELPLTVQLDIHWRDPQLEYHKKLCSSLRRRFRTGRSNKRFKWVIKNPITAKDIEREFEKTVQRLMFRNRVFAQFCKKC